MKINRILLNLIPFLLLILTPVLPEALAMGTATPPLDQPAGLSGYHAHIPLKVENQAADQLPEGYTVTYILNTSTLISQGEMLNSCNDLRITYRGDGVEEELDRLVIGCNSTTTQVVFRTQAAIPGEDSDSDYHLYYNNPDAENPPMNPNNIYAFYDDFEDGEASHWTIEDGTWGIVQDNGNRIYRYTGGGTNWAIAQRSLSGVADLEIIGDVRAAANTNWIGYAFRIKDKDNFLTFYTGRDESPNKFKYARVINDNHSIMSSPDTSMSANVWYTMRIHAVGDQLRARFWEKGKPEPENWMIQYSDHTFHAETNIGLTLYQHTTNADWDNIQVRKLVNVEPRVTETDQGQPISNWYYRSQITVKNESSTETLPKKYSMYIDVDTEELISLGKMLDTCKNLQIGFSPENDDIYQIDRVVENCNTANTRVWFALQNQILPSAEDARYYLLYGTPDPEEPLANGMKVFLFFEDWENGTTHWTGAGGLDSANTGKMGNTNVSTEEFVSPGHSQEFPEKAGGGDAFSGYIPVKPNTQYAISTWAKAGEATWAPVGFDPYNSSQTSAGAEVWLWTDDWSIPSTWGWRSGRFTTNNDTSFIKIKSEWWSDAAGNSPVYMDNMGLRFAVNTDPSFNLGAEETTVALPTIDSIQDNSENGVIYLGIELSVSANVSLPEGEGEIDTVVLKTTSPDNNETTMIFNSVTEEWSANYKPTKTGSLTYQILVKMKSGIRTTSPKKEIKVVSKVDVCTWKDCKKGAESWSIDDSHNNCANDLEEAGFRGTFFVNGITTQAWYADYSVVGHEIASHTVSHPCTVPCCSPNCTPETLNACSIPENFVDEYRQTQLEPNIAAIETGTGKAVRTLAWPCGCVDPGRIEAASQYYLGARGYFDYVANLTWVKDINLPVPEFYNLYTDTDYNKGFIDRAAAEGKWAIITSHGSCEGIEYMGSRQEDLWAAPIGEVLGYIKIRENIHEKLTESGEYESFTNYELSEDGKTITFDAKHSIEPWERVALEEGIELLPIIYDDPVSLHVYLPNELSPVAVKVGPDENGMKDVPFEEMEIDGIRYVVFDAQLDTPQHVVITLGAPAPQIAGIESLTNTVEIGNNVTIQANVTIRAEYSISSVKLKLLTPEEKEINMTINSGNQFQTSFKPEKLGPYTYQIIATNIEDNSRVSAIYTFNVIDTTAPAWQERTQTSDHITKNTMNALSAKAQDPGGLVRAILSTNETGEWQDFNWWNQNWGKRISLTVQEIQGLARTNEIVKVEVTSSQFLGLTNCEEELRVADDLGIEIPSQVYDEQQEEGELTCQLLFQASVPANSSRTYYVYYKDGNTTIPTYSTDLSVTTNTNTNTRLIQNSFFDLDLNTSSDAGIISRMQLPQGNNSKLPLALEENHYWGLHQVCSSAGNITGKNRLCGANPAAQASELTLKETLSGPLMREFIFTSEKASAEFKMIYRFMANSPFYEYTLTVSEIPEEPENSENPLAQPEALPTVMNNFWFQDGYFNRLGAGKETIDKSFNTYNDGKDHIRMVSFEEVDTGTIDGTDNDGAFLGGTDYNEPTANDLSLYVVTGTDQDDINEILEKIKFPLSMTIGDPENMPDSTYGSPQEITPTTDLYTASFNWQHPSLNDQIVHWRIKFCDLSGNCQYTDPIGFSIGTPTSVDLNYFRAARMDAGIQLSWETVSEATLAGFDLYRKEEGGVFVKVNDSMIMPLAGGSPFGAVYTYLDTGANPNKLYEYRLESFETLDTSTSSGFVLTTYWPYSVMLPVIKR